jgi:hypothetical protein
VSGGVGFAACLAFYVATSVFHVNASTASGPVEARIFHAVLPMTVTGAEDLVDKIIANVPTCVTSGVDRQTQQGLARTQSAPRRAM